MSRRLYFLFPLLALALSPPLPVPVRAEGAFPPVRDEFLANIFSDNLLATRTSLVSRVAKHDSRDAALTLLMGAKGLGDKIDGLLAKLARVEKKHEEVNTNQDVKEDDYETRTNLRAEMAELEKLILTDREIVGVIETACLGR